MQKLMLPRTFNFGIAESDLQTIGSILPQKKEFAQKPMWEVFAKKQGIEAPLYGTYKYANAKTDIQAISDLGLKSYRTSISMSRTIDSKGNINKKAFQWYRTYFSELKSKGLEIHLCLYHWEAPEIFTELGVLHPEFKSYFLKHTEAVLNNLNDLVDFYIPMNELWCICFLSYLIGIHAPGKRDISLFFESYFKMVELQAEVIRMIKKHNKKNKVGIVNIHFPTYTLGKDKKHTDIRHIADHVTNYMYSDPFFFGKLDAKLVEAYKNYFPADYKSTVKNANVADKIDYYGVNYYTSQYVVPSNAPLGYDQYQPENSLSNSLGWPVAIPPFYPNGLTNILISYSKRYKKAGLKNIIVSENGTPELTRKTDHGLQDPFRIFYITEHLKQIEEAVKKNVPVKGYFLWTLLDNYEWQEAYKPEGAFGLMSVDKKTGKRTPKTSYFWFQSLLKQFYSS
jgi:beta-glucosidase